MVENLFLECIESVKKLRGRSRKTAPLRNHEKQRVMEMLLGNEDI